MIVVVFLFLKTNLFTHSEWVVLESVFLLPIAPPWCLDLFFKDVGSSSADIGRLLEASIGAVAIPEGITFEVKSQLRLVKSRSSSIFNEASPLKNKFQILNNEHLVTILTFKGASLNDVRSLGGRGVSENLTLLNKISKFYSIKV